MIDKVQKIREEVEKLKSQLLRGACSSQIAMETRCKEEAYDEVLAILDTMQEEPVSIWHDASKKSDNLEDVVIINPSDNTGEVLTRCIGVNQGHIWAYTSELLKLDNPCNIGKNLQEEHISEDLEKENKIEILADIIFNAAKHGYMPYDTQDEYCAMEIAKKNIDKFIAPKKQEKLVSEELENAANEWNTKASFTPFYMTLDGNDNPNGVKQDYTTHAESFKAGAKWQKEQMMTKSIEAVISQVPCSNEIILYNPSSVDKYYLPQEMNNLGVNKGDKVKLIFIKED